MNKLRKEQLIAEVKIYLKEITYINDYLTVYLDLVDCIKNPDSLTVINQAPAFFTITLSAIESSIIMGISRLFDSNVETKTIKKLIIRCKNETKLFPAEIHTTYIYVNEKDRSEKNSKKLDVKRMLNQLEQEGEKFVESEVLEHIKIRRDKIYAHNDSKFFVDKSFVPNIAIEEVRELLIFGTDSCNQILNALCGEVIATHSSNIDDLHKLLESVQRMKG